MTNKVHLSSLEYVRATGGRATLANFYEDHEPVGPAIWDQLLTEGLVEIDSAGKVRLTAAGAEALSAGTEKGLNRARESFRDSRTDNSLDLTNPLNPISPLSPLNASYETETHRSDHCSISHSSDSSTGYVSSSSSSDSCSSSDSGSSSDY